MRLQQNRSNGCYFIGCTKYPNCKKTLNIGNPKKCELSNKECLTYKGKLFSISDDNNQSFICLGNCLKESNYNNNNKNNYNNKSNKRKRKKNNRNYKRRNNENNYEELEE